MAIPTTILNARVKNKIATNEYWLSVEDELGPILAGEMALVYDDEGLAVNFKVGDGTKLYSELPFFIAYFNNVTNCKVLSYINQTANLTISGVFRNKSEIAKVYFINASGSPKTLKFGTEDGGSQLGEIELNDGVNVLKFDYLFTTAQTVYITGLTGVSYSMFILYYQLDEQPVIPPSTPSGGGSSWKYGTIYAFAPMYIGHTAIAWDFLSGLGRVGTDYEGAVLCGTNGIPDFSDGYLIGYKDGDTLGGSVGSNTKTILFANLPEMEINIPANIGGVSGSGGIMFNGANNNPNVNPGVRDAAGNPFAGQTAMDIKPKSKVVLFFTGLPTTT